MKMYSGSSRGGGFTLIELMVVIAIMAVLAAILVPAVSKAMSRGKATGCLSNVRQWGIGLIAYLPDHDGYYPWDGDDVMAGNFAHPEWWANALPRYVGQQSYLTMATAGVPVPPQSTMYSCSSATKPANAPYKAGAFKYYFGTVMNSKLNQDVTANASGQKIIRDVLINSPANTIAMLELRSVPDEISKSDPNYGNDLLRCKASWTRMAARHRNGANMVFGDGHAALTDYATAQKSNGGDYNQTGLIWNPLGAAN